MKNLLVAFLAIAIIFTSCEKEDEPTTTTTTTTNNTNFAFSCKIDGVDFTDNNPVATILSPNTLNIVASNGSDEVIIYIYNIDNTSLGEEISLASTSNRVYVNLGADYYSNNISGKLIFSKTGNPVSGIFDAQGTNLETFQSITITDGEFINVAY